MGRASQRKGRNGEKELTRILQENGIPARPGQALNYGTEPDIVGVPGIHVECKRSEKLRLSEWMAQAIGDSEKFKDGVPVVFHRRNREGWLCTARLEDFLKISKAFLGGNKEESL